ncbi:tetratricopeptide (TPR) repeat protein [Paenibacillus sp. DS2015]|uniref:DUF6483 family protein n=1 Tax=Paenibacillus sp. DS2015 TaxID=3373917 RepID=UPI003D2559B0
MFRKDYILRIVEDMTQMVAKVFALRQERKFTEALWEIDELMGKDFRFNSRLLNSLSKEDLIDMFRFRDTLESDKMQGVALLLEEEGKIYTDMGESDEGMTRFMKSLHLFLYADDYGANRELFDLPQQIERLLERIKEYRLPAATDQLLFVYLDKQGKYAEAENVLYRLLDQGEIDPAKGISFYERLMQEEDQRLELGRLPRAEVVEGMKAIQLKLN